MTESDTLQAPPRRLPNLPRNIWAFTLTSLLTDISSEMLLNVGPLFLANVLGTPTAAIGAIEGAAETTLSLLKAGSGWFSDRLSQRKWLTFSGYALSTVSKPLMAFAATWQGYLVVRVTDRAGKGIRNPPRDAMIADSIDEKQRGLAFGVHRAGDRFGAALGLTLALLITLAIQGNAALITRETFQTLALVSLIPATLALIVLAVGVREVARKHAAKTGDAGGWRELGRPFYLFLFVIMVFSLGNSTDSFLILRAQERGLTVVEVLGMLITFNIVYAAFSSPLGALSDKVGRKRLIIGGWLAYGLIYLGFAAANTGAQVWIIFALYGLYYAAVEGAAKAHVADLVPVLRRGTAYGLFSMTVGLMALPASLLAGFLWQNIGSNSPFFVGGALALLACALLALLPASRSDG